MKHLLFFLAVFICAVAVGTWAFVRNSGAARSEAVETEERLPNEWVEHSFPTGELNALCQKAALPGNERRLFSEWSFYVDLGDDQDGVKFYRVAGKLATKPDCEFDFITPQEGLKALCNEALFLTEIENHGWLQTSGDYAKSATRGVVDWGQDVGTMISQVRIMLENIVHNSWRIASDANYRKQFINSVTEWATKVGCQLSNISVTEIWKRVRSIDFERVKIAVGGIGRAYWENAREKEALSHGFSTAQIRLGQTTWKAIDRGTRTRIAGQLAPDVAMIVVAIFFLPESGGDSGEAILASELGKAATEIGECAIQEQRVAKVEDLKRMARLFPEAGAIADRTAVLEKSTATITLMDEQRTCGIISSLLDVEKISTLKGIRAANRRLKLVLFHLNDAERAGMQPTKILENVYVQAGGKAMALSPKAADYERNMILANYRLARQWGLFETPENLEALRKGNAARILHGQYAGDLIDIDHRIPVKFAPELGNQPANLFISPASVNRSRGARIDQRALTAIKEFRDVSDWHPSSALQDAIKAAGH